MVSDNGRYPSFPHFLELDDDIYTIVFIVMSIPEKNVFWMGWDRHIQMLSIDDYFALI